MTVDTGGGLVCGRYNSPIAMAARAKEAGCKIQQAESGFNRISIDS